MSAAEITQLTWVGVAAVAAPVVALGVRRAVVPGVVIELILGVVLGPTLLDWVKPVGLVLNFANFGLALLMFLAGLGSALVGVMSNLFEQVDRRGEETRLAERRRRRGL